MSAESLELARRALVAFRERDVAIVREIFHEEGEFRSAIVGGLEGGVFRGHDDIGIYFRSLDDVFADWHTEDERYLEADDGRVVCVYRVVGSGKGSGVPIDQRAAVVFTIADRKVSSCEAYLDPAEALEAVGLEAAMLEEERR